MAFSKSPLTALGSFGLAAGGAVALQPALPTLQKFAEQNFLHLSGFNFWNYLVILIAVILEGPVAMLLGGVWASMGRVNFWGILAVAVLAGLLADTFWYYFGCFGREQVINRWGRYFKIDLAAVNRMEEVLFGRNPLRVLFIAKLTTALIIPALIAAGMTKLGWRKVICTVIPAQLVWSAGLTGLGFLMADSFARISQKVENFGWLAAVVLILGLIGYVMYRWRKVRAKMPIY